MSDITIYDVDPIAMTAVVSSGGGGYSMTVEYDSTTFSTLDDWFREMPGSITVNVTSSTVPSGYALEATGDGSWTATSSSSLVGTLTLSTGGDESWSFTIVLTDGVEAVARHDPTVTARKYGPTLPA